MLPEPLRSSMSITIPRRFNVDRDHDPFQRGHRAALQKVIERGADPSLDPGSVDRVERPQRALDVGGPVTLEEAATLLLRQALERGKVVAGDVVLVVARVHAQFRILGRIDRSPGLGVAALLPELVGVVAGAGRVAVEVLAGCEAL